MNKKWFAIYVVVLLIITLVLLVGAAVYPCANHPTYLKCVSPSGVVMFEGETDDGMTRLGNAFKVTGYEWEVNGVPYMATSATSCVEHEIKR